MRRRPRPVLLATLDGLLDCTLCWAAAPLQGQLLGDPCIGVLPEGLACSLPELVRDGAEARRGGKGLACLPWREVAALRARAGQSPRCAWEQVRMAVDTRLSTDLPGAGIMSPPGVPCCLTDCS